MMIKHLSAALLTCVVVVAPAAAQDREVLASSISIGGSQASPSGSSMRLDDLATTGGTQVLLRDATTKEIAARLLGVSDIPSPFTRDDVAETITQPWTFSAGITGPLSVTTRVTTPEITTSAGNLTLKPVGDLILDPTGNDILPSAGYEDNFGALNKKYLTVHAAELWVETLVAQNTIATIGGRVLVGPTTTLTADLSAAATSISVKHNQMASGDRVYLEANGKVEFLAVTSGASGSGPYTYTVTRNLDGSGANEWYAGDAVFNTGTTGDGFLDLYSVAGVLSGAGPTIVGNVRTGTTYNQVAPRWAIGNLNGLYGYGTDTYGAAFGDAADVFLAADATNGIRILEGGSTVRAQWATDGTLTVGNTATNSGNVQIASNAINLRSGTQTRLQLAASNGELNIYDPGGVPRVTIGSGYAVFGRVATGQPNVLIDPSAGSLAVRNGTANRILLSGSNGAIQLYAPDSTRRLYLGDIGAGVYGLILGDSSTAGEPFVQIDESTMQFCAAGLGCTLTFNGTTGNITSVGNLALNGTATVGSGITVSTSGYLRSGQTSYATGTGYWLEYNSGTPRVSIGGSSKYLRWTGSELQVQTDGLQISDAGIVTNEVEIDHTGVHIGSSTSAFTIDGNPIFFDDGNNRWEFGAGLSAGGIISSGGVTTSGDIGSNSNFRFFMNGQTGQSQTITVRDSAGTGTCTLVFTGGIKTGGTC